MNILKLNEKKIKTELHLKKSFALNLHTGFR